MSGSMNIFQNVNNIISNDPRRTVFFIWVFGDVLQTWVVFKNLLEISKLTKINFIEKWRSFNNQSTPNVTTEAYNEHRDDQLVRSSAIIISGIIGICLKCYKFSSNYYNDVWKWTDGRGWTPIGRACAFACVDKFSDAARDVVVALVEIIVGTRAAEMDTLHWLLNRATETLETAVICYVAAFFMGVSKPGVFYATWMTIRVAPLVAQWYALMYAERDYSPLPDSMSTITELAGYPKSRIVLVKNVESAAGMNKRLGRLGAKYCNFVVTNYIFVSSELISFREDEYAAIVLREAGEWKMWWYSRSYLKLLYEFAYHFVMGYLTIQAYDNGEATEKIFRLDSGMHPIVHLIVSKTFFHHAIISVVNLVVGSFEAYTEFLKDDYVCKVMKSNQKLHEALAKQTEQDLSGASVYGSFYSRRFFGVPTIWERMDRMTQHQSNSQ